ncbi:restriction endonuclease [Moraxella osloensis]|nr:restriction endonuclease [Moraxella osloensis]MBL7667543.1 restriction endonuclease [Moraxella osloensis]
MAIPSFEEVLTFIFKKVRNRLSTKTSHGVLAIALRKKYEIKEISYCSFWNRYGLITRFEDFDKIYNEKLGKPYRGGEDFYENLCLFGCDVLKAFGLISGYENNGLKDYSFLGDNFEGNINLNVLKTKTDYPQGLKFLANAIVNNGYEMATYRKINYNYEIAKKDIAYKIQSFNKRIYNNQDPFLCQLEKDLLLTLDQMFAINLADEKQNGLEKVNLSKTIIELRTQIKSQNDLVAENEKLKQQIQSLTSEINQLKAKPQQDSFCHEELNLEDLLLQKLKQLHPTAFEKFSLELIKSVALARGGEVEIFHNGQVGDGGVDGVIEAPKTFGKGKEKVFVQCKRYDKTSIGRPELQAFAGAMLTEDITVGIFITTSTFSKQAINYVEELDNKGKSIELFDGQRIIKHMLRNKIAVIEKITSSFEIDESYFDKFN